MGTITEPRPGAPTAAVQFLSFALPVLKCAVCPACLSVLGGLFAGARMGLLGDERVHGSIIALALVADFFILRAAMRHHGSRWPLLLCLAGVAVAVLGHFTAEAVELIGFGILMLAAVQNVVLLRRHRKQGGSCCTHEVGAHVGAAPRTRLMPPIGFSLGRFRVRVYRHEMRLLVNHDPKSSGPGWRC